MRVDCSPTVRLEATVDKLGFWPTVWMAGQKDLKVGRESEQAPKRLTTGNAPSKTGGNLWEAEAGI